MCMRERGKIKFKVGSLKLVINENEKETAACS